MTANNWFQETFPGSDKWKAASENKEHGGEQVCCEDSRYLDDDLAYSSTVYGSIIRHCAG